LASILEEIWAVVDIDLKITAIFIADESASLIWELDLTRLELVHFRKLTFRDKSRKPEGICRKNLIGQRDHT